MHSNGKAPPGETLKGKHAQQINQELSGRKFLDKVIAFNTLFPTAQRRFSVNVSK